MRFFGALLILYLIFFKTIGISNDLSGSYLAAKHAEKLGDLNSAAKYFKKVLTKDPKNFKIMGGLVESYVGLGDFQSAFSVTKILASSDFSNETIQLAIIAQFAKNSDFPNLLSHLDRGQGLRHFLIDGLIRSWTLVGLERNAEAISALDELSRNSEVASFVLYHKALILISQQKFEEAEQIFSMLDETTGHMTPRRNAIRVQSLLKQGKFYQAETIFKKSFGDNPVPPYIDLKRHIESNTKPGDMIIETANDGLAEVFFSIAKILSNETEDKYTLGHCRVAEFLQKENAEATLLCGDILEGMGQYEIAIQTYQKINEDHPLYGFSELGRANALKRSGKTQRAVRVLEELIMQKPQLIEAHITLGDVWRSLEEYKKAILAYTDALKMIKINKNISWQVLYSRGIAYERMGDWDKAEKDFRDALEIRPNQPYILNYLGYSLVEKKIKLDEALELIKKAVEIRSDSGYIVDSLGWALFKLSKSQEAVPHLEKAVSLLPSDPIINDHLGDVYWAVGRKREARFQWKRALSFDPEAVEAKKIRKKLEIGLDKFLKEEGSNSKTNVNVQ